MFPFLPLYCGNMIVKTQIPVLKHQEPSLKGAIPSLKQEEPKLKAAIPYLKLQAPNLKVIVPSRYKSLTGQVFFLQELHKPSTVCLVSREVSKIA